jgi:ribosomal protein S18 acetylase RimI-like enzyme
MNERVTVRPARTQDIQTAAAILVAGFRDMFEAAFRSRLDRAERVVARTLEVEISRGTSGLHVAEIAGQVVGTVSLRQRGQPEAPVWPTTAILFEEMGLLGGFRAMFYLSLLDQPVGRQEAYVSDVVVTPGFRRRGVGRSMMGRIERLARDWGKRVCVLDVNAKNEGARQFYLRLDYEEQRLRRSLLTRWLLGTGEWVRMGKKIA